MASIGDCIVNENLPFCRTPSRSSPSSKTIDTRPPLSARTRHANRRNAPIAATPPPPPTVALVATVNARARSPLATSKAETTNKKRKTVANLVEETDATPPSKQKLPVTVRTPSRHSTPFTPSSISDTVTPLLDGVTPHLILQRLQAMFKNEPIDCSSIRTLPCVSARLFACYAIYLDWTRSNLLTTPGRPTRNSTPAMQYTKPLQSLMTAMVRVELIGLDHESVSVSGSGNRPHQTKQISFRAFDCSSTLPPVDRVHGSDGHQQASIHALESANQAVHDIIRNTSDRDVLVASLDSLVDFLNQASCQQSSSCLWDQLAASISLSFHPRRIRNTIRDYLQEFSALRTRMIDSVMDSPYPVLMAEQRFAELVGQAIRFQLRMLLNEKPPRLSPQDLDYDLWSQRYSKVNDLIVMELSEGQSNGSVDDGCISALVSNALCVLYEFFGPNFLDHSTPTLTVPTVFCQLPSSNQGITREKGRSSNGLTTNLTDVVRDIEEACSFLAAAQATVFLRDLWTAPGVAREISRRGGWTETEDYATMSWKFDLWKLCPNDAHLVVLSNHTALFQRLEHLATRMMTPQRDCQSALQALETRFRLRTKQASLLSRYPEIGVAAETLQQGLAVANFPTVRSANTTI